MVSIQDIVFTRGHCGNIELEFLLSESLPFYEHSQRVPEDEERLIGIAKMARAFQNAMYGEADIDPTLRPSRELCRESGLVGGKLSCWAIDQYRPLYHGSRPPIRVTPGNSLVPIEILERLEALSQNLKVLIVQYQAYSHSPNLLHVQVWPTDKRFGPKVKEKFRELLFP